MVALAALINLLLSRQSPPYYALALALLDGPSVALQWTATLYYGFKICPPDLVGTMASLSGTFQWVVGKGIGSFAGGQLSGPLGLPGVFIYSGSVLAAATSVVWLLYRIWGGRWEADVLERKRIVVEAMEDAADGNNEKKQSGRKTSSIRVEEQVHGGEADEVSKL